MSLPPSPPSSDAASPRARDRRLPKRFAPIAFAFYMAGIMALLMSTVIVAASGDYRPGFVSRVLHAYALAMPIAFVSVLAIRPVVVRLVGWTVRL